MNELYKSIMAAIGQFYLKFKRTEKARTPQHNPLYNKTPYDIQPVETRPPGDEGESHRYPPYLEGLPTLHPKKILAEQKEIVDRIISTCNIEIEKPGLVRNTLENYAAAVHLIPASESHHHADSGGLLRHGLEVANLALLLLNEYSPLARDHFAEQREHLAPRLRYAVLVAALGHDLGKPVTDMTIADASGKLKWNPMKETLYEWSQNNSVDRYFLHWSASRNKKHEPVSLLMLGYVMGPEGREFITEVDSVLLSQAVESVSGDPSASNVIAKIVKRADSSSTERDQRRRGTGGFGSGMPIEQYYLDAMRALTRRKEWKINKPGGKIWVIGGDAYLVWPSAAEDMQKHFMSNKVKGIPFDPITILNELGDRGFLRPRVADMGKQTWIWPIVPNEIRSRLNAPLNSVCLMAQDLLFDIEVKSVDGVKGADAIAVFSKSDKAEVIEEKGHGDIAQDHPEPAPEASEDTAESFEPQTDKEKVQEKESNEKKPARAAKPRAQKITNDERHHAEASAKIDAGNTSRKEAPPEIVNEHVNRPRANQQSAQTETQRPNRVSATEAEQNLKKKGLIGMVLVALAKDLNRHDPEIEILKSRKVGDEKLLLLLRTPEFFKDFHDDEDTIKDDALSSGIFQLTEEGSLEWVADDHVWWALNPEASLWFFALIPSYIARFAKKKEKKQPDGDESSVKHESREDPVGREGGAVEVVENDRKQTAQEPDSFEREKDGNEDPSNEEFKQEDRIDPEDGLTPNSEDKTHLNNHESYKAQVNKAGEDSVKADVAPVDRDLKITNVVVRLLQTKRDEGATEISAEDVVTEIKSVQKRFSLTILNRLLSDQKEFVIDANSGMIDLKGGDKP